jgi:hypothetical protein
VYAEESELAPKLSSNGFSFDHTMQKFEKNSFGYNDCERTSKKNGFFSVASASNQSSSSLAAVMALRLSSLTLPDTMSMIKNDIF